MTCLYYCNNCELFSILIYINCELFLYPAMFSVSDTAMFYVFDISTDMWMWERMSWFHKKGKALQERKQFTWKKGQEAFEEN